MPRAGATRDRVLVAPDSFKGTLTAPEVAAAIGKGIERAGLEADLCPLADGGEGTAEVLLSALGGERVEARAHDPLGRPITAEFVLLGGGTTAALDAAAASGLHLVSEDERDPEAASTAGTGELIVAAVQAGAHTVLVGAGGTATTDGGAGALAAIEAAGGLGRAKLTVLCDVRTQWERCAEVFAPQKGADPETVRRLSQRLRALASELPKDPTGVPMGGAAGGLAGGLWAAGAELASGSQHVLAAAGFDVRMLAAHHVVLGEGRLDPQSLMGKIVGEAATRCRQAGVPCSAIVGQRALDPLDARIIDLQNVLEAGTAEALAEAGERLAALM